MGPEELRRRSLLAPAATVAAAVFLLSGCGGSGSTTGSDANSGPKLFSAKVVGEEVEVSYQVPGGADAGSSVRISLLEPESGVPPVNASVSPLTDDEGSVNVGSAVGPERELIVFGSVFGNEGRREYFNTIYLHSPPGPIPPSMIGPRAGTAEALRNCLEEKRGRQRPKVRCRS